MRREAVVVSANQCIGPKGALAGLPVDCALIRLGIGVRSTTKKETGLENAISMSTSIKKKVSQNRTNLQQTKQTTNDHFFCQKINKVFELSPILQNLKVMSVLHNFFENCPKRTIFKNCRKGCH